MNLKSELKKDEDGTINISIAIPWSQVEKTKEEVIDEHVKDATLPGFRKGMAPKKLVEESLSKDHVKEDILRKILPQSYSDAVKEHKLSPIVTPRIQVQDLEDRKDWHFTAQTCEMPKIDLGNYKEDIKKVTAKSKIVVPGKEPMAVSFDEISKVLLENVKFTVPKVLVEQEVERLLSQTLDEIKRLGLTLDQYLASTGRTIETLKQSYAEKAQNEVRLEFILSQIASTESIKVEEKEIDEAITSAKDEKERQNLQSNRYLLASIIRQQKTLDFIRNL